MVSKKRKFDMDEFRERMTLIDEACRIRGINSIDFVAQCIEAHRKGFPAPSLLPEDPKGQKEFGYALQRALTERKTKGSQRS